MKFQKKLTEITRTFQDPLLAETCLPYKEWKKAIKYQTPSQTLTDLERQCETIDRVFTQAYHQLHHPPKPVPWWKQSLCGIKTTIAPMVPTVPPEELLVYADINAQAVYKVCKKLEKNKKIPGAMEFLTELRSKHIYTFLGGSHRLTRLRLGLPDADPDHHSCPICFEELAPAVLFPCGHYQCFQCLCRMTDYSQIPATFYNRLTLISLTFACPFCRFQFRSRHLDPKDSFWPTLPPDAHKGYLRPLRPPLNPSLNPSLNPPLNPPLTPSYQSSPNL
jgi:RING-type zinc-finger